MGSIVENTGLARRHISDPPAAHSSHREEVWGQRKSRCHAWQEGLGDIRVQAGNQWRVLSLHSHAEHAPEKRAPPTHRRPPSISRARSQDSCRSQWQREGPGGELDGLRSQARGHEHVYCLSHQLVPHLYTSDRTLTGLGALTSEGATPPEPCHWPTAPSPEERGHTLSRLNHCVLLSAQVHWASDSSPWRYSFPEPPTCVPDTRSRTRRLWAACAGPSGGHTHQPDSECSQ